MPKEKITFDSPKKQEIKEKEKKLKKEGGLVYETKKDPETGEKKNFVNILGVKIETNASQKEVEEIKEDIIFSKLDKMLLRRMAECYKLKQPLLLESDPGAGKTYLLHQFVKMIHGKDAPILQINGSPKMNELDILGHWAPNNMNQEQTERYEDFLQDNMSSGKMKQLSDDFSQKMAKINEKLEKGEMSEEEFQEEFGKLTTEYINMQQDLLRNQAKGAKFEGEGKSDWHFQEGPLLKAYSGNNGKGFPLLVDEFNLIPSKYQQIFLQISGHDGGLSDSIHFWGSGDKTTYERGENTWIVFTSNFPEKTAGRSEVVPPMSDRLVWQVVDNEDFKEKKKSLILTAGGRLEKTKQEIFKETGLEFIEPEVENGIEWDEALDEKMGEQIAEIVELLDSEFVDYYNKVGDSLEFATGEKRRRTQKLEFSSRNALRLFSYLDHFQVRNKETGEIDFTKTLKMAFNIYYISRLASNEGKEKMKRLFEEVLEGTTGQIEIEPDEEQKQELEDLFNKKNQELLDKLKSEKEKVEEAIKNTKNAKVSPHNAENIAVDTKNIKTSNPNIEKLLKDTDVDIVTLLGYKTPEQAIKDFQKEKSSRLEKLKSIKKNINDLFSKLTYYRNEFLDNNTVEGIKTRKEYLEILVEEYKNQDEEIKAPEADIDIDVEYFRKRFSPKVKVTSDMNLDKPVIAAQDEDFKRSLNEIMGSVPVESFFIHLGDVAKSRVEKIEKEGREKGEEYYFLEKAIKKDAINIKEIKSILDELTPIQEGSILDEAADKDEKENIQGAHLDLIKDKIYNLLDSGSDLYDSIDEIFQIYEFKKESEKKEITPEIIKEELGEQSHFTKKTRESLIKEIKGGDVNGLVEILKEFLSNRLKDDQNIQLFVSSSSFNPEVWGDYKEKLDKVEKIIEKGCNIPIVLTMYVDQEIIEQELGPDISQDMIERIKRYYNSKPKKAKKLLSFLDLPRQLKELPKNENVFLREIGDLRVDKIRDKVIESYMENIKKDNRVPLYSLNYETKKEILNAIEDDKELKQKIINKNASIVDAVCFNNLYDDEEGRKVQDRIKKSRFMSFFKHFVDKEGPLIVLADSNFEDHIKDSEIFEEMKESGKGVHFVKTAKPEKTVENIKKVL